LKNFRRDKKRGAGVLAEYSPLGESGGGIEKDEGRTRLGDNFYKGKNKDGGLRVLGGGNTP